MTMKLLPLLLALSLCACAGVHESDWNYADGVHRVGKSKLLHRQTKIPLVSRAQR